MSAGAFVSSKYESDAGDIFRCRVQPETLAANIGGVNAAPAGDVDQPVSAKVSGSNREIGMKCRGVYIRWTSTVPAGYDDEKATLFIPIMTPAIYNGINPGTTGTYLTNPVEVIGKKPERVR